MASGMLTSDPAHSVGCSHVIGASKMRMVDSYDAGDCD